MQTDLFVTHANENNNESQQHLEENKLHFNKQCEKVYGLLMTGNVLTVFGSMVHHKISSLPRRILDLKQKGIQISDEWDGSDSGVKVKHYFMSEANREANKKLLK